MRGAASRTPLVRWPRWRLCAGTLPPSRGLPETRPMTMEPAATQRVGWRTHVRTSSIARLLALAIVALMTWYFLTTDAVRWDNAFFVPDALLILFLLVSALLPYRVARFALIFAFAWAAAVYTVSLFTYVVRGDFLEGANHLALILPGVLMAVLLAYDIDRGRRPGVAS